MDSYPDPDAAFWASLSGHKQTTRSQKEGLGDMGLHPDEVAACHSVPCVECGRATRVMLLANLDSHMGCVPGPCTVQSPTAPRAIRRPVFDMQITLSRACDCPVLHVVVPRRLLASWRAFAYIPLRPVPDVVDQ